VPVVTSAIAMAHGLGLDVVAEGIETPAQLAFLTAHGCETGQGYLLGRPTRAEELFPQRRSSSV
jgi:EAL domain-containing protein (putative c-di-GMP-specific phosphodiesterase class I)